MKKILRLLSLIKFGIIFGNSFAFFAGFALAGGDSVELFSKVALFTSLVIACGCVINNCYDVDVDQLMERTRNRALVKKEFSKQFALVFASTLGIIAFTLGFFTLNILTVLIAAFGLVSYVIFYTILAKRYTIYGVHVGSISGAIPPIIGYCSVSNTFDIHAAILFIMLVSWQIPHSFAINIFRAQDYKNAQIPTFPFSNGVDRTKISIVIYIALFGLCNIVLSPGTSIFHWLTSFILVLWWLRIAIKGFRVEAKLTKQWAKKVFFISIINMMGVSLSIGANIIL